MFSILRSLFYNFKYLSFIQAIHLPIKVGKNTFMHGDGDIILDIPISNLKRGIISIGLNYEKCINSKTDRTQVYIWQVTLLWKSKYRDWYKDCDSSQRFIVDRK